VTWQFIPCGGQEIFVLSKQPNIFVKIFQPIQLIQAFILLALTVHFIHPCNKPKGKIHPVIDHESPEGNIDIAAHFL
jgi:hypothetical protein